MSAGGDGRLRPPGRERTHAHRQADPRGVRPARRLDRRLGQGRERVRVSWSWRRAGPTFLDSPHTW